MIIMTFLLFLAVCGLGYGFYRLYERVVEMDKLLSKEVGNEARIEELESLVGGLISSTETTGGGTGSPEIAGGGTGEK